MKKRRRTHVQTSSGTVWLPALLLLALSFVLGTVSGCYFAGTVSDSENSALISYVEGYLFAARNGDFAAPALLQVIYEIYRWPVLVFLFSFTAAGLIGIPILFCVRSFLLSFSVSSLIRVLGGSGAILAFLLFGLTGALSLPILFVLGVQGMNACRFLAARLAGEKGKRPVYGKSYFGRVGICMMTLVCCTFLEQAVIPSLIIILAGTF